MDVETLSLLLRLVGKDLNQFGFSLLRLCVSVTLFEKRIFYRVTET
jgi:hypothetical protein